MSILRWSDLRDVLPGQSVWVTVAKIYTNNGPLIESDLGLTDEDLVTLAEKDGAEGASMKKRLVQVKMSRIMLKDLLTGLSAAVLTFSKGNLFERILAVRLKKSIDVLKYLFGKTNSFSYRYLTEKEEIK